MPVYMLSEMPYDEYVGWFAYLEARPIGWREDDRTYKLMQAQGLKEKPENIFHSLAQVKKNNSAAADSNPISSLKNSVFMMNMLNSKGGVKLEM